MKILLILSSTDNPWLFQEVVVYLYMFNLQFLVDKDIQVFAKTRGIIISYCLWIAEGF